jgi:tRNA-splicing ligase RtcB
MQKVMDNVYRWGVHEEAAIQQLIMCAGDGRAAAGALMGDGHLGYSMPVGGVVGYRGHVSPSGVGYDIACGNKAVRLNAKGTDVRKDIKRIMNEVQKKISFGIGRSNKESVEHELFDDNSWNLDCIGEIGKRTKGKEGSSNLKDIAASQLGTVGSGNHYVDIFVDENDDVWVGCHFGSRGLGHKIATYFLHKAGGKDDINAYPTLISDTSELGLDYIECMKLAGRYAYAGRDWVCDRVAKILRAKVVEEIHNHHNFAWEEEHNGEKLWVVRKGATPAFPGQLGFVGGSMGDKSVILKGVESEESKLTLYSTVHGAGRVMGRMQAKGKFKPIKDLSGNKTGKFECVREPMVKKEDMMKWVNDMGVELRGADVDESPFVYKRIEEVLDFHKNTVEIIHWLTPIGVCMASSDIRDPYKD